MTVASTGPPGASAHDTGWLRPVQLCLATAVSGPEAGAWRRPTASVWRRSEENQQRRPDALKVPLAPTSCVTTDGPVLAVYRITTADHTQTGLLADVKVAAWEARRVRGHEHTRYAKEEALLAELDDVEALVGPVALGHRPEPELGALLEGLSSGRRTASWESAGETLHELWVVEGTKLEELATRSAALDPLYIVDGHHRIAAAARRAAGRHAATADDDPWGAFLAAVFPADQLVVRAIHRIVDVAGAGTPDALLGRLEALGTLTSVDGPEDARARRKKQFGVGFAGRWYRLDIRPSAGRSCPDAQLLDELVLGPVLGIDDPRNDMRIDFFPDLGDLRPVAERCRDTNEIAFLVRPLAVDEVFAIADSGAALPPKSTWFDPKPIKGAVMPAQRLAERAWGPQSLLEASRPAG